MKNVKKVTILKKMAILLSILGDGTWDVQNTSLSNNNAVKPSGWSFSDIIFLIVIIAIHCIFTYCVYKKKDGVFACFYFFLAPIAIFEIQNNNGGRVY
ncbi:MAG: hypothetical protein LBG79_04070 [Spirochaetaceae bacterium]|jgi:hypothetical protein|nr:hypothetical protein [Spirochaetaceae bacterium]